MDDRSHSIKTRYGQITPPEDDLKVNWSPASPTNPSSLPASTSAHHRRPSEESSSSEPPSSINNTTTGTKSRRAGVEKKDKYREKNRVAAAKCRAKKKEHTDGLEETHRTQAMLNSLLKQTEQNLRDELSFWRTQALQHAYCECGPIQEYNLRKAKALASDKDFGGPEFRRTSAGETSSSEGPGSSVDFMAMRASDRTF